MVACSPVRDATARDCLPEALLIEEVEIENTVHVALSYRGPLRIYRPLDSQDLRIRLRHIRNISKGQILGDLLLQRQSRRRSSRGAHDLRIDLQLGHSEKPLQLAGDRIRHCLAEHRGSAHLLETL